MTTLPVRSGRLSSFHLGFLIFSDPASWKSEERWLEEGSGAGDDMEKRRGEGQAAAEMLCQVYELIYPFQGLPR